MNRFFLFVCLVLIVTVSSCPNTCVCKWKGGKQWMECRDKGLITIPEATASETQVLDMSGNNLQILPKETFRRAGLINLQKLFLARCHIGQIDPRALDGLTNIIEIDLSENLLTSIPSLTFQSVPFLRDLTLASNPIQKIEKGAFQYVPALEKLDISNCEIEQILPEGFNGAKSIESIKLNGNRLSHFPLSSVESLNKLMMIELHDNPWVCDCKMRGVKIWLTEGNKAPVQPICSAGPDRLLMKQFSELHADDFACKPEIRMDSRYVESVSGENATIVCRVDSIPTASISWNWNGRLLLNNSAFSSYQRVFIVEQGESDKSMKSSLILTNAQSSDSGRFHCVAENRAGMSDANFTLHVNYRGVGLSFLGGSHITGISLALVFLIIIILIIIIYLLIRLRTISYPNSKNPSQVEVMTNGTAHAVVNKTPSITPVIETSSFTERKQFPPPSYNSTEMSPNGQIPNKTLHSVINISNPDLINDTRKPEGLSPEPHNDEVLFQTSYWNQTIRQASNSELGFDSNDRTPIIDGVSIGGELEDNYPPDYGLPIIGTGQNELVPNNVHPNAKTLRVWQRGVPVLPPVNALKRVLSRGSPDEGYQEGNGTDV